MIEVRKTTSGFDVVHADGTVLFSGAEESAVFARAGVLAALAKRRGNRPKADELLVLFPPTAPEPLILGAAFGLSVDLKREDTLDQASNTWTMRNVEIFREGVALKVGRDGKGKKLAFTADDVVDFVEAFAELGWQPPIKITHGEDQAIVLDQLPSIARTVALRAAEVGGVQAGASVLRLLADLEKVPQPLYEAIRGGKLPQRSIEFWRNAVPRIKGEGTYRMALKAVALLGDELPAVRGMPPLDVAPMKFSATGATEVVTTDLENDPVTTTDPKGPATITLSAEEYQKQKQEFETLKASDVARKTELEDLRKQTVRLAMDRTIEAATTLAARFRTEGKITPAQEPLALEILKSLDDEKKDAVTLSVASDKGATEQKLSARGAFVKFLESLAVNPNAPGLPKTKGNQGDPNAEGFATLSLEDQHKRIADIGAKYFVDKTKGFPTEISAYEQARKDLIEGKVS